MACLWQIVGRDMVDERSRVRSSHVQLAVCAPVDDARPRHHCVTLASHRLEPVGAAVLRPVAGRVARQREPVRLLPACNESRSSRRCRESRRAVRLARAW